ncbi:MAG: 2,3-bisphosphoglycerate-independent phosphoglycerate mutase [Candidatus Thiodiazotropha sp. (ex Lucinoma borealis)]|nr:2,3-bisphosphoglycerate-independent phosphoglycerate mutase [Candidatus Thiodiazotropha sp. (ex Lucinoma borealis)]MCU7837772.1 2,3-bisphosphoglycerate-independent phosphoglycerate mutase [Candidatus Thiodiazotropha sp. (ex Troendleina suluensis)]MCU7864488.1 2,3-bisphosphoglycerate-independent phosphoglycerate mutase [Candidatus Thiodiazotropha sp. (ex Lucinoma borealis)]MCU7867817.1 2,3-bisphosphoglycerate-independent phosphoglycerate mutase [Candidatus Thiodiazotropha sp. (ex Lucinoma bore
MLTTHKGLMIILDGLGDRGIPAFGGKTPLEAADTPNMDILASAGQCGLVDPLFPGMPVGTHTGICLLFGLSKHQAMKLARGPVEASGVGLNKNDQALFFRCNFATLEKTKDRYNILDRRAGRINTGAESLAAEIGQLDLGDGITASLHPATQHRVVLQLEGAGLSHDISNTDSGNQYQSKGLLSCHANDPTDSAAVSTSKAVNRLMDIIYEKLSNHPLNLMRIEKDLPPANGIICRSPGKLPKVKPLLKNLKLKTAVISGERTVLGLGELLGYTLFKDDRFTATYETDLNTKVKTAMQALDDHDMVYLHIKATDIYSHDQNPAGKREILSKIDDAIAPLISDSLVIAITADHCTDTNTGRHTGDPIPSLIYNPLGRIDGCQQFSELACAMGGLGRINSSGFLLTMLDQMNQLENFRPKDSSFIS